MSYVPKEYWLERGKVYKQEFQYNRKFKLQEQMLIDYLKKNVSFSNILEVGCGFGRITKLLLSNFSEVTDYVAVDLSPEQIENAKKYVSEVDNKNTLKFIVSDIQSLSLDTKYDLVIAPEVLLHILPAEIKDVIAKLESWSKKNIVNVDWYEEVVPRKAAPHNFIHQYEEIYLRMPRVVRVTRIPITKKGLFSRIDTKQSIFHALLKEG
ncbi:MAG: class I SAM-dependent methyltransferase [Thermoproteota archaeon]|jgi:putative sugar O-methyltransferase|nr:class I SAM-dependent methyltransferase [Thermoproteota archaeon]